MAKREWLDDLFHQYFEGALNFITVLMLGTGAGELCGVQARVFGYEGKGVGVASKETAGRVVVRMFSELQLAT